MTETLQQREDRRKIWISRVFANTGGIDPDTLYTEARKQFDEANPIEKCVDYNPPR